MLRKLALGVLLIMITSAAAPALAAGPEADNGTAVSISPAVGTKGEVVTQSTPWVALPDCPIAASRPAGAVVGDRFYVIGGEESGGTRNGYVREYDPVTGTWDNTNTQMPTPASNISAGVIGTDIYIPGGYTGSNYLDTLQVYHTASDTWETVATDPLPVGLLAPACAVLGGKLYVFGGETNSGYVDTTYIYDPSAAAGARWTTGAAAPTTGAYGDALATDGYLFYAGMRNGTADLAGVYRYDPAADSWTTMPSLTTPRGAAQMWTYEGKLAVGGGGWSTYLNSVEEYDLSTGTGGSWTAGNSLITGRRTFAAAQDDVNGVLYAAAGYNGAFMSSAEASTFEVEARPTPIPTLSQWGIIIMSLILAGSAIWMIRRRQIA